MEETDRRRAIQKAYNEEHGITPQTVKRRVSGLTEYYDFDVLAEEPEVGDIIKEYKKDESAIQKKIKDLKKQMKKHSDKLEFEDAALVRDEIKRLQMLELSLTD